MRRPRSPLSAALSPWVARSAALSPWVVCSAALSPWVVRSAALGACFLLAACGREVPGGHAPDAGDAAMDAGPDDAGEDALVEDAQALSDDAAGPEDGGEDAGADVEVPWFEEVGAASGLSFDRAPSEALASLADRMSGGVCVLDVDGVPPLDLFFTARPTATGGSRLFVARGPLDYEERTSAAGLGDVGDAMACLAFDADGDGDDDLLVPGRGEIRLFLNVGGSFVDQTRRLPPVGATHLYMSAAAGDVDGDGDVDLLVAGFVDDDRAHLPADCGALPCATDLGRLPGVPNVLLLRTPSGDYVDDTLRSAPDAARAEPTLVVGIARLEGRGPVDLWIGNDYGTLYDDRPLRRATPTAPFADVSALIGLATNQRGYGTDTMGWSTGDVDGDGNVDHVTSSYALDATAVYLCRDGFCEDRARTIGTTVTERTFRWGAALADFDLDGDLDLIEATGHVYLDSELAATHGVGPSDQPPNLYENRGGVLAVRSSAEGPAFALPGQHRGVALVDLDEDGRLDVVMAPRTGAPLVLHNVRPPRGHWLRVALRGRGANRGAAGALVTVTHASGTIVRSHVIGEGYLGSFDPRVHFGVPGGAPVDISVLWPDGTTTTQAHVAVDRDVLLTEP